MYTTSGLSVLLQDFISLPDAMSCNKRRYNIGPDARKPVFGGLPTTKVQSTLHICADWSAPLLIPYWNYHIYTSFKGNFNILASL